MTFVYCT